MATFSITDTLPMPSCSHRIPRLGFGVYQSHGPQCIKSTQLALKAGYRHIDTAQMYGNEAEVGEAVRTSGLPRSDVFITTKIFSAKGSPEATYKSVLESVEKIGGEGGYVYLFLVHTASGGAAGRKEMYQALEKLYEEGKAKSIGVSNWGVGHNEEMKSYAKVWPPHVNQIELHPWCQQRRLVEYCHEKGIVVEAYCPLVRGRKANDKTLTAIAEKYKKTWGQILIRYCLQKNWVPLPKSDNPERIQQNADVYGFNIEEEDMKALDALDQGRSGAIVMAAQD